MTTPDNIAPRNVQNVANEGSATQINDPHAPVIVNPQGSNITINNWVAARLEQMVASGTGELPQSGTPYFVGREVEIEELHQKVETGEPTAISAIAGMGGIGKTELALQYALKHRELGTYPGGICWLRAREEVGTQIVSFARSHLRLTMPEGLDLPGQVAFCWQEWGDGTTLIVFDDVQDYAEIKPSLPPQKSQFKVVLTTRSRFGSPVQNYEIQVLSEDDSLKLLKSLVNDGRIEQDLETAKQVCQWLGYLPLGLELVGRYLARKQGTSIAKVWQRLQAKKLAAQALLEAESGMTASLGVVAAFELSWQELDETAQAIAAFLSLFALAEIPWSIVQACISGLDEEELEDLRDRQLVNLSLLSFEREATYQLHQLLREFFAVKRSQMPEDEAMKRSFCAVMVSISQQLSQTVTLAVIKQITPVIPHLKEAATTLNSWLIDEELTEPSTGIARFYEGQSAFGEAEEWYQHGRENATQRLGENHPDVATSLNNLAELYRLQGRYGEAEVLFARSLEIDSLFYGEDHSEIATVLNNLATLYLSQGRYGEAEPLLLQALNIRQRRLREDHPSVATSLSNLAALYQAQGRYGEAEPLLLQALNIRQRQLREDHPSVAISLSNLATLYQAQGRYEEAEPLLLRSLEINQQQLGEDHPNVASSLNNLAELYRSQGQYEKAELLYIRALEISNRILGIAHPTTMNVRQNYATFLKLMVAAFNVRSLPS